jgi:hypothetical protein
VSYVTRQGNPERWEGKASIPSDNWLPNDVYQGFSTLAFTVGGPVRPLGNGVTLFADLLAQGMIDSEPRARGLTCLQPEDGDEELAAAINALSGDPATGHLYCPFTSPRLPYQRGDRLIGFFRFDAPVAATTRPGSWWASSGRSCRIWKLKPRQPSGRRPDKRSRRRGGNPRHDRRTLEATMR